MLALLLLLPAVAQDLGDLPVLRVGTTIEAEITDEDPEVHTPTLDAGYTQAPTVGKAYRIRVERSGPYTIALRSYDFDSYLVLRDESSEVLAEDDDGLVGLHSRLVVDLDASEVYLVEACAIYGLRGNFELEVAASARPVLSTAERARLAVEDARAALEHAEWKFGPEDPRTARSLNTLAVSLTSMGEYAAAQPLFERALALTEARLGSDHPETAASLGNLAMLLTYMGEYAAAKPLFERALAIRQARLGADHPDTATSLRTLAGLLEIMGEYAGAKPLAEHALAICEARLGADHPDTARSLKNVAGLLQAMGDYAGAKPLYERALAIFEARLGADHSETAASLGDLAGLLHSMGDYAGAKPLYERALAIFEAQLGADHRSTGASLNNLAGLLKSMGDYAAAKPLFERALAIYEAELGADHPDTAASLNNLALLHASMGDYTAAMPLYERALAILEAKRGAHHPDTAMSLSNLALLLHSMGDYAVAKPLFERALAIREAQLGADHPDTGTSLHNLAFLLDSMGDHDGARPLYERALAISEAELGSDHPSTAESLNSLAALLRSMGDYAGAKPLYERALAIREAQLGAHHSTATSLNNLAELLHSMGDHAAAKLLLERALAIYEAELGTDHPLTATSLNNLARLLDDMGDYAAAKPHFERALAICEAHLGSDHPLTAAGLNNLAGLLLDAGDFRRSWELVRRGHEGMRIHLARVLASRRPDESSRYLAQLRWQQEVLLSFPRMDEAHELDEGAASALLAWKGQVGRAARAARAVTRRSPKAATLADELRARTTELSRLAYDTEMPAEARARRLEQVRAEITSLELGLRELVEVSSLDDVGLDDLLEHLAGDAALLSFFVHRVWVPARREGDEVVEPGRWSEPRLVAWIVRPGQDVVSVDLGSADAIEKETSAFLRSLAVDRGESVAVEEVDPDAALFAWLWAPLAEHLEGAERIVVSHDRFTATLPFEVLRDEDGRYLIEDRSFVYLHDLQSIAGFEEEPARQYGSLFAVGDVNFSARDEAPEIATATRGDSEAPTERWTFWGPLDRTRNEIETIGALHEAFVPDGSRLLLTGAEATEERVLEELPKASIVHLATHGYFRPAGLPSMWKAAQEEAERQRGLVGTRTGDELLDVDRALAGYAPEVLSGLAFAGANLPPEEGRLDGYLTAADVDWLDLSGVELITLSACETGLGRSESGEGMSGFRTTLLRAGAETVITSLWKVPDDATQELMSRFYENLLRHGMGKLEALREAQLWMLRENRRRYDGDPRPHTWGAFVLSGDWR